MVKAALTILRDLFLLAFLVGLLFFPKPLNSLLTKAGIAEIHGGIFEWQQQVRQAASQNKVAAQANSNASDILGQVQTTLVNIVNTSKDPTIKKQAADAANSVEASLTSLGNVDASLTKSLVTQESILQSASAALPAAAAAAPIPVSQGWIYLGKTDSQHKSWITPPQPKTSAQSPALRAGQVITLTDDLYLRADKTPQDQTFNQAAIVGAVRSGSVATISDAQYSPARGGGDFVWAKVVVKGNQ
ncbi:MAG TPA: hypothetical protein VGG56_02630 [Terracidiphilus sp.]